MDGVLFKIDFDNANDNVKWSFLQYALHMKGSIKKWRQWIAHFVQKGSVGIRVNDDISPYFQTTKYLRQGDHLPLILFNIVANMLDILIARAKEYGQVGGYLGALSHI